MRVYHLGAIAVMALVAGGSAAAKDKAPPPPPQVWQDMVKCKQIADPTARLACFDGQVGKLEQATNSGDLVLADRATMKQARKGLFGFRLPSLGLFGGNKDGSDADEVSEIDTTVTSARQFGYGNWRLTLADGSVWEQTDDVKLLFDPRSGNKVHIYKGAVGTFRVNIDGQRAIKMRRVE